MTVLPAFKFSSAGLPADEGFDAWRQIMARMFNIERSQADGARPSGGVSAYSLGEVMINRSVFTAQRLTRDERRIDATPDHLVLQFYLAGGFVGEMNGKDTRISRGEIAICDLRHRLNVQAMASSTIGVTIPRDLLDARTLDRLPPRLAPSRERLLRARMVALHHSLPILTRSEIQLAVAETIAALRRLLDPAVPLDPLNAPEFDVDHFHLAKEFIAGALASNDLTPPAIAANLGISRATLYRIFAPVGGVMEHVWTMRLEAVRATLEQSLEPRTLTRLATDNGFKNPAHLSRIFRARYGTSPRGWRQEHAIRSQDGWRTEAARLDACWSSLKRS